MTYSVVVPVYNGEKTVVPLFEAIDATFKNTEHNYEVIFVYDCGPDNSWKVLKQLQLEHSSRVKLIKLSRNYGQHNALISGFTLVKGDFCVTIDEDLQHRPADILKLISKQREGGYHLVYGRASQDEHSNFRNVTSSILRRLIAFGIPEIHCDYSSFRLIDSRIAKETIDMRNSYTFLDGYLSWLTKSVASVKVSHQARHAGKSAYTVKKLVDHSMNIFFTFSRLPVRLLTVLSISVLLSTSVYSTYILIRKLVYDDLASGFATVVIVLGFGLGFVMLSLGIIGEYIYRINLKTTRRPNYYIEKIL